MSDGILDGFKDLEWIGEARDVQHRPTTAFERLVNLSYDLLTDVQGEDRPWNHLVTYIYPREVHHHKPYLALYNRLRQELAEVDFNVDDLVNFILARIDRENNGSLWQIISHQRNESPQFALGVYTGCLLHILTERNRSIGKPTNVYIDGKGAPFPFLFAFAKEFDEIVVENFKGDYICSFVGSFEGHGGTVVVTNCEGNNLLDEAGMNKGVINNIILLNNTCSSAGNGTAKYGGEVKNIVLVNNNIHTCFEAIGKSGRVNNFFAINTESYKFAHEAGSSFMPHETYKGDKSSIQEIYAQHGYVGNIIILNPILVRGTQSVSGIGSNYGYVDKLVVSGHCFLSQIASGHGRVRTVFFIDNTSKYNFLISDVAPNGGIIDNLMIRKDGQYKVLKGIKGIHPKTNELLSSNTLELDAEPDEDFSIKSKVDNVLFGEEAQREYQRIMHEEKVDELISFVQSFEGKDYREILKLLEMNF